MAITGKPSKAGGNQKTRASRDPPRLTHVAMAYRRVGRYRTKRGSRRGPVHNSHARAGRACQMSSRATPCPTLAAIARPAIHDAGKRSLHGASPRCRCRVASWERPPSGMSAEIANDRLWPKADIHNSKTIAPILQPCILALSLSQPRSGCAPSAGHGEGMDARVEATQEQLPDGPPLYPRPLCGGESGRSPASAKQGVVFSWLLLFYSGHSALRPSGQLRCSRTHPACTWTSKREVIRPPQEVESSSL
jgi:hypothetical protein